LHSDDSTGGIVRLAAPVAVGTASFVAILLVDLIWVGYLGPPPLAALGLALRSAGVMGVYIGALSVALTSLAGRRVCEGRLEAVEPLLVSGSRVGAGLHLLQATGMTVLAPSCVREARRRPRWWPPPRSSSPYLTGPRRAFC